MEKLLKKVYSSQSNVRLLKLLSYVLVPLVAISFAVLLALEYINSPIIAVKLFFFALIPFILVSILRAILNLPRPYEVYSFCELTPKHKRGRSFPSRHTFSAFLAATLSFHFSFWVTIPLAIMAVLIALSRIFLGMHFIRDVAAGAFIGILSGVIGIILL